MGEQGKRRLQAIFFSDIVGYSRQMEEDELAALAALRAHNAILDAAADAHGGRVVKTVGDAYMIAFDSSVAAVACALEAQARIEGSPIAGAGGAPIRIRVGIHAGDVQEEGDDLFGEAVNLAARLEGQADAGSVCISEAVLAQVRGRVEASVRGPELRKLKNIAEPVPVYLLEPAKAWEVTGSAAPVRPSPRARAAWVGLGLLCLLLSMGIVRWAMGPTAVPLARPAPPAEGTTDAAPRVGGALTILTSVGRTRPLRLDQFEDTPSLDRLANAISAESLFAGGAHGDVEPWLVDQFSILEGRHARIHLRPEVRFQPHPCLREQATPATADDLVFSLEVFLPIGGLTVAGPSPQVTRIWAEGEVVHLETREVESRLFNILSSVPLLPRAMSGCAALEDPEVFLPATGPFRVASASAKQITLEAFPDYWRKDGEGRSLPYLSKILLRQVEVPGSRVSKLLSGEAQLIALGDDEGEAFISLNPTTRRLEARGPLAGSGVLLGRRGRLQSIIQGFFPIPSGPGPLEHRSVRQAVSLAVSGRCTDCPERSVTFATGRLLEPSQPGFDPRYAGRRHDLEAARRAREVAEAELGPLGPLTVGCPTGGSRYCRTLIDDLRAAGFEATLSLVGPEQIKPAMLEGAFDLVKARWGQSEALRKQSEIFLSDWFDFMPLVGYPEAAGFELAREVRDHPTEARRLELIAALERYLIDEGVAIPFTRGVTVNADAGLGVFVADARLQGWIDPVAGLAPMDLARLAEAWLAEPSAP